MPLLPSSAEVQRRRATQAKISQFHSRPTGPGQCSAVHVQLVAAPLPVVWSVVRRFDRPQRYKHFLRGCVMLAGDGSVGSIREVSVMSGLPASSSMERLDMLDDIEHVVRFSIVGGDHRLRNYQSTTSLHDGGGGGAAETVVVESYMVDVPAGNSNEDTVLFTDTIVQGNLKGLAAVSERMFGSSSAV